MVLSICKACRGDTYNIIVRAARQNANATLAKMQIENDRELAREELATTEIMEEMAAQDNIGSGEAIVAEPSVCTKKTHRKAMYANVVHPHAHICLFTARSDIVRGCAHS